MATYVKSLAVAVYTNNHSTLASKQISKSQVRKVHIKVAHIRVLMVRLYSPSSVIDVFAEMSTDHKRMHM